MDSEKIFNALNQIKLSIDQHKDEIEKLDQEIGNFAEGGTPHSFVIG